MELANAVRGMRKLKGWTQQEMSKKLTVANSGYNIFELYSAPYHLKIVQSVMKNLDLFTEEEVKEIKRLYEKKRAYEIENGSPDVNPYEKRPSTRIPDIPNFYERLDALGDLKHVDVNDPRLQDLREAVGQKRIYRGKSYDRTTYDVRIKMGKVLRAIREKTGLNSISFARTLGVTPTEYGKVEFGRRSSQSKVLRQLAESDYYSEEDSRIISDLYHDMQEEERHQMKKVFQHENAKL